MLYSLDQLILRFFTKFCHWFQRLIGKTNFWWAIALNFLGVLAIPIYLIWNVVTPAQVPLTPLLRSYLIVSGLLIAVAHFPVKRIYRDLETHYVSGNSTAHTLTLEWQTRYGIRWLNIAIIANIFASFVNSGGVNILSLAVCVLLSAWWIEKYVRAIIPLPPGKSRIQEWKEAFAAGFRKLIPVSSSSR